MALTANPFTFESVALVPGTFASPAHCLGVNYGSRPGLEDFVVNQKAKPTAALIATRQKTLRDSEWRMS